MQILDSCRWGITFLVTDSRFSEEERDALMIKAITMYLAGQKKGRIKTEVYEGEISSNGEYQMLGSFGGQRFRAVLDTDHGKSRLEFLVTEKIREELN